MRHFSHRQTTGKDGRKERGHSDYLQGQYNELIEISVHLQIPFAGKNFSKTATAQITG